MADSHIIRCGPENTRDPMFMEIAAKDATELATYTTACIPGSIGYLDDGTEYRLGTAGTWVLTKSAPTPAT